MHRPLIAAILLGVAVALSVMCAIGLAIVKDALERLHFTAPVTSFSAGLIAVAVWIGDPNWQSRLKVTLIAAALFVMNSILSHSTARAIWIRNKGHFEPQPQDHVGLITEQNPTGARR
jgi:multisubunit Na+/H+ antiporter MnhG subunit